MKKNDNQPRSTAMDLQLAAVCTDHDAIELRLNERKRLLQIFDQVDEIACLQNLADLQPRMLDLFIKIAEAESATYLQLDTDTDELVVRSVRGDAESQYLVGLRMNRQESLPADPKSGGTPIVIGDLVSDPRWLRVVNPAIAARLVNVIVLPLETKDRVLGLIQIYNFTHVEMDLLQRISSRFATEINRLLISFAERQMNQRLLSLLDVISHLAGTVDRSSMLHSVTEAVCALVDAERSSTFLVDPVTKEMIFHVSYQATDQEKSNLNEIHAARGSFPFGSKARNQTLNTAGSDEGVLSYFSSNAITVPIPVWSDSKTERGLSKSNLGELMAFTNGRGSFQENDIHLIEILAQQASAFLQVADLHDHTAELFIDSVTALVAAIDAKDPYTQGHSQRVSDYSLLIGQEMGLGETELNNLRFGSLFHDVGKIGIPDAILKSVNPLSADEWEKVKRHPLTGINIMNKVKMLATSLPAIIEHHEHLDGSGYPGGLSGRQISLQGRIVAVADVFDAMTSDRPYRPAMDVPHVLEHLRSKADIWYDKKCIDALVRIVTRTQTNSREL
jgi:HD-GYP domain-containing protein (c-di-GMP phosphodiesterase class II)